ncbi:MAG: hypothetical protein GF375_04360 [Candidatus Omnitrophica bacterium]|nr:hypothetical protein [Candidatus Omnitrophota bacterium]
MSERYPCKYDKTPESIARKNPCVTCELGINRDKRGELCPVRFLLNKVKELEEKLKTD